MATTEEQKLTIEELKAKAETKIKAVVKKRKPNMSIIKFISEFARYLALAEKDKERLARAGFSLDNLALYIVFLQMLNEEHAERIAAEGEKSTPADLYQEGLRRAKMYRKVLKEGINYVIDETENKQVIAAYDKISPGKSNADVLHDVLSLATTLKDFLDVVSGIKPGEIDINEGYLENISRDVEKTITLEGEAATTDSGRSIHVDRQNRLITLCMDATDDIKRYAKAAFLFEEEYFTEHYANHAIRDRNNPSTDSDETEIDDEFSQEETEENTSNTEE